MIKCKKCGQALSPDSNTLDFSNVQICPDCLKENCSICGNLLSIDEINSGKNICDLCSINSCFPMSNYAVKSNTWKCNISSLTLEEQQILIRKLVVEKDYRSLILPHHVLYLYGANRMLSYGISDVVFCDSNYNEIKLSQLEIEIPNYKPKNLFFDVEDKVLVKDSEGEPWSLALFSHKDDCLFTTSAGKFKYCISYVGNETLVGV